MKWKEEVVETERGRERLNNILLGELLEIIWFVRSSAEEEDRRKVVPDLLASQLTPTQWEILMHFQWLANNASFFQVPLSIPCFIHIFSISGKRRFYLSMKKLNLPNEPPCIFGGTKKVQLLDSRSLY